MRSVWRLASGLFVLSAGSRSARGSFASVAVFVRPMEQEQASRLMLEELVECATGTKRSVVSITVIATHTAEKIGRKGVGIGIVLPRDGDDFAVFGDLEVVTFECGTIEGEVEHQVAGFDDCL